MKCTLCLEMAEVGEYCTSHARAWENLQKAFKIWATGYGDIPLSEFLGRVEKLPQTGLKTKDIVHLLSKDPSRWK